MPATYTPLRYPGGKTKLYSMIAPILRASVGEESLYVEPFAGGAGLALKLLFCRDVKSIILNDIDENIYLFWRACVETPEKLCTMIEDAELSISEWDRQKGIYDTPGRHSDLERAFALFYLNRCNRSGIIKGGPIGGRDQKGTYKIGARFNKENLMRKVKAIGKRKADIEIYCMDGKDFIRKVCSGLPEKNTIVNIDPPYVNKGQELYINAFAKKDHEELSVAIKELTQPWIVTYDANDLIRNLYGEYSIQEIELGYSAGNTRKTGSEYFITNIARGGAEKNVQIY